MPNAKRLTEARLREIGAAPVDLLVRLIDEPTDVEVETATGGRYRLRTHAFWDTEPWESDLFVRVKTTGKGPRALERYYGVETRGPEDDFAPAPGGVHEASPTWTEVTAWLVFALVVLGALAGVALVVSGLF